MLNKCHTTKSKNTDKKCHTRERTQLPIIKLMLTFSIPCDNSFSKFEKERS
jgi:DNA polymerase sigma